MNKSNTSDKSFSWAVIGAGPAGILSVCKLIDEGVKASEIAWLDPAFQVGDFSRYWQYVPSNTTVSLFLKVINSIKCVSPQTTAKLFTLDKSGYCLLGDVVEVLQHFTACLQKKVNSFESTVKAIDHSSRGWIIQSEKASFIAKKVILSIGSVEKSLPINTTAEIIKLTHALNPNKLKKEVTNEDKVAVFGSSHSAILAMKNLAELGCDQIYNFYKSPCKYATKTNVGTLYENTGLKAVAAKWALENIEKNSRPGLKRVFSSSDNIQQYLNSCQKVIYAVGFERRNEILVNGLSLNETGYDNHTGIISSGLYGIGIAFPQRVQDHWKREEDNVGLFKFQTFINSVLSLWQIYPSSIK